MSLLFYKRATIVLSLACGVLVVCCGLLLVELTPLKIRLMMAVEQVEMFRWMLDASRKPGSTTANIADNMDGAIHYYPSGTKQIAGSRLDQLVEAARQSHLREMIALLRIQTGEDLGDVPEPWLAKFGSRR